MQSFYLYLVEAFQLLTSLSIRLYFSEARALDRIFNYTYRLCDTVLPIQIYFKSFFKLSFHAHLRDSLIYLLSALFKELLRQDPYFLELRGCLSVSRRQDCSSGLLNFPIFKAF